MKTKTLLLLLLFSTNLFAQIVNIPDPIFKNLLLLSYDTNNDGEIQVTEAEAVAGILNVSGDPFIPGEIVNMTGIEAFVNITELYCQINLIESLDLSQNLALEVINCYNNNLTSINLGTNTVLTELHCQENQITSLDVSQNTNLVNIWCYYNWLTAVNLNGASALQHVNFNYNDLTSLDVSTNNSLIYLYAHHNGITSIDTSNNDLLETLALGYNQLSVIATDNNTNLKVLGCNNNQITNLDISQNILLHTISFASNMITLIDVSRCIFLEKIWGGGNQLTEIDLSLNSKLEIVKFENNQLIAMNIQNTNNLLITDFDTTNNPYLHCIFVDNIEYSINNWTDIDSNSHFVETQAECDAIGIDEHLSTQISIYPNPVSDYLYITASKDTYKKTKVKITDLIGKTYYKTLLNANQTTKIDFSLFSKGVYILTLKTNNNQVLTHKIIKL